MRADPELSWAKTPSAERERERERERKRTNNGEGRAHRDKEGEREGEDSEKRDWEKEGGKEGWIELGEWEREKNVQRSGRVRK